MYKKPIFQKTGLMVNNSYEAKTLEDQISDMIAKGEEPIHVTKKEFQPRNEGIKASWNIRTDRWDIAIDAMDKVAKSHQARREERAKAKEASENTKNNDGGAESTGGKQTA